VAGLGYLNTYGIAGNVCTLAVASHGNESFAVTMLHGSAGPKTCPHPSGRACTRNDPSSLWMGAVSASTTVTAGNAL
jgi:hypothetical protein